MRIYVLSECTYDYYCFEKVVGAFANLEDIKQSGKVGELPLYSRQEFEAMNTDGKYDGLAHYIYDIYDVWKGRYINENP